LLKANSLIDTSLKAIFKLYIYLFIWTTNLVSNFLPSYEGLSTWLWKWLIISKTLSWDNCFINCILYITYHLHAFISYVIPRFSYASYIRPTLDKGLGPSQIKLWFSLHWFLRENHLIHTQKTELKGELMVWRTKV
jgi:hypothetical protein